MNKLTPLIAAAAIAVMPVPAASAASVPDMRAPTHLAPEDPATANSWPSSQYPELYQSTTRLRGIMATGAPHGDFAVALKERSGWYSVITVERSLAAQEFARLQERKRVAETNHPEDAAKAETELRAWSRSPNPDDVWERHCSIGLEPVLAQKLIEIWARMLQDTRENEYDWIVVDGQTDHFWFNRDGKTLAGRTLSPPDDTNPGKLAAILRALPAYCQSGTNANLNAVDTLMMHKSDRNRIETLADGLLANLLSAQHAPPSKGGL